MCVCVCVSVLISHFFHIENTYVVSIEICYNFVLNWIINHSIHSQHFIETEHYAEETPFDVVTLPGLSFTYSIHGMCNYPILHVAGLAQRFCNGLPCNNSGFDSWWGRCKNWASRPSQGTVNGCSVSKWPHCRWLNTTNQPYSPYMMVPLL